MGVLELLSDVVSQTWTERLYKAWFRRHLFSITPQAVAVWCRQLGHEVYYATYYGQQQPERLLLSKLDVIFISTFTQASALAYVLAKFYRRAKTLRFALTRAACRGFAFCGEAFARDHRLLNRIN